MERKKIMIVGPIGDRGGREIEAGYFAKSLFKAGYQIEIISTSYLTRKSQIFLYVAREKANSIYESIFKENYIYKTLAIFSWLKNMGKHQPYCFTSNFIAKRFFKYDHEAALLLEDRVKKIDMLIFIGQLTSNYSRELIELGNKYQKSIIFRTTGKIAFNLNIPLYFEKVNVFLHHSAKNHNSNLKKINPNYEVLDQTALNESFLLKIPLRNRKPKTFLMIGEISDHKGVQNVLEYFSRAGAPEDKILILGEGDSKAGLEMKYNKKKNIEFLGFIQHTEINNYLKIADCLIIASEAETGPLVGLEAMAAGMLILSTRVGAMEERLKDTLNEYWFEKDDFKSFENQFIKVKNLQINKVNSIALANRKKYMDEYSNFAITTQLNQIVKKYI